MLWKLVFHCSAAHDWCLWSVHGGGTIPQAIKHLQSIMPMYDFGGHTPQNFLKPTQHIAPDWYFAGGSEWLSTPSMSIDCNHQVTTTSCYVSTWQSTGECDCYLVVCIWQKIWRIYWAITTYLDEQSGGYLFDGLDKSIWLQDIIILVPGTDYAGNITNQELCHTSINLKRFVKCVHGTW